MIFAFDLDGTLCSLEEDYKNAEPFEERIARVNSLYDSGHIIYIYTARGSTKGIAKFRKLTKKQLKDWGVKHHKLIFGKPHYDLHVDDKSTNASSYFIAGGVY